MRHGLAQGRAIIEGHKESFPAAMKSLERDLEETLAALKFPLAHRHWIRTTNLLERLFGEGRRRTKVIPRFRSEASGLALIFAVLLDASEGWRGVKMKPRALERLDQIAADPDGDWSDPELEQYAA